MKKLSFLAAIAVAVLLTACNGSGNSSAESADASGDTTALINAALEQQEVEEMSNVINSLSACLDSIQLQENLIFKNSENASKKEVLERLRAFKDLLARKQAEINKLSANNKSNKATIANLNKVTEYLKAELESKTKQIEKLTEAVEKKDAKISELRYDLNIMSQQREALIDDNVRQDQIINEVFYIVADKKTLKNLGLTTGGGLRKTKADYANLDESKFTRRDKRGLKTIQINSKNPKLLTEKPASSYELIKNEDKTTTLKIIDTQAFWAASPYLIVME